MYIEKNNSPKLPKDCYYVEGKLYNLNLLYNNNNNNNIHFVFRCKIYSNSHYKLRTMNLYIQKKTLANMCVCETVIVRVRIMCILHIAQVQPTYI